MEFVAGEEERERGGQGDGAIEEVGKRRQRERERDEGGGKTENRERRGGVGGFGSEHNVVLRRGDVHRK